MLTIHRFASPFCLAGLVLCLVAACRIDGHYDPLPIDAAPDTPIDADGSIPPESVTIPGGPFLRGCNQAVEDCTNLTDQVPLAMVNVSTFTIDGAEVTQAAYKQCIDAGMCTTPSTAFDPLNRGSHPVGGVTWQQAVDYCAYKGKRLPTEAEWEKASRGIDGRKHSWGNADPTCQFAHYLNCTLGDTSPLPVGSKLGDSPFGLKDMSGNIAEWVSDWYGNQYYYTSPSMDPQGPTTGTYKVIRGGGFGYGTNYLRSSYRALGNPTTAPRSVGFRCVQN